MKRIYAIYQKVSEYNSTITFMWLTLKIHKYTEMNFINKNENMFQVDKTFDELIPKIHSYMSTE